MVISQPPGNNPSYYYRFTNAASIVLNASRDTFAFYTCNYNIRVTHRNGAIKHIFLHESDPRRDHQQIVLYSFCRSMRLPISVKILVKSFSRRFEHVGLYTSRRLLPPECQQDRTLLRNQYY